MAVIVKDDREIGIMREAGLHMKTVDYVPCYRSEAGTGSGLGFSIWQ